MNERMNERTNTYIRTAARDVYIQSIIDGALGEDQKDPLH